MLGDFDAFVSLEEQRGTHPQCFASCSFLGVLWVAECVRAAVELPIGCASFQVVPLNAIAEIRKDNLAISASSFALSFFRPLSGPR